MTTKIQPGDYLYLTPYGENEYLDEYWIIKITDINKKNITYEDTVLITKEKTERVNTPQEGFINRTKKLIYYNDEDTEEPDKTWRYTYKKLKLHEAMAYLI